MLTFQQCLVMYFAVCGLLTLVCGLLWKEIPWPGYLLTAVPTAALICLEQGYGTAFIVLSVICCLAMLPFAFATLADIGRLFIPAVIEIVLTVVLTSHLPAEPAWQRILYGISLCCVFFSANGYYVLCEVRYDLNHLH